MATISTPQASPVSNGLINGDMRVAQRGVTLGLNSNATTSATSAVVTGISSTTNIRKGMVVVGNANIPAGRTVSTVDSATQITLNSGASVTAGSAVATVFAPANDTYTLDQWNLLTSGAPGAVLVAQDTSVVPTGAYASLRSTITALNNAKFGLVNFIENRDIAPFLVSGVASLSFQARVTGTSISAIRAGIIQWTGTADSLTSDIISAWGAAGTNPTLVASWAFANTPADLVPTTSFQTFSISNIAISSTATNLGVVIWNDDVTTVAADILYIGDVNLTPTAVALPIVRRPLAEESALAGWYHEYMLAPAANDIFALAQGLTATTAKFLVPWRWAKRTSPTLTFSANADIGILNSDHSNAGTGTLATANTGTSSGVVSMTSIGTVTLAAAGAYMVRWATATGAIDVSSEL